MQALRLALHRLTLTKLRQTLRTIRTIRTLPRNYAYTIPSTILFTPLTNADATQHFYHQDPQTDFLTALSRGDPIALSQAKNHPPANLPPALASAALAALAENNVAVATAALAHLADLASLPGNHSFFTTPTIVSLQTILSSCPSYISRLFGATPVPSQVLHHATRTIANLAAETATHQLLLSTPLLNPLCQILQTTDGDTLHEAIRAVSALSKTDPAAVVSARGHTHLIKFAIDGTDRLFAAAGIRNLARHIDDVRVHREVVVAGVVNALVECFKQRGQTCVFGILAFGDLMTTKHPKKHLIQTRLQPAFHQFTVLLNEKNVTISRAMYRVLQTMFETSDGEQVVPKELADLLAQQCGQLVNGACARGDLAALKAVRAMCNNATVSKGMVDKGLLEVLVRGVQKGKGEYWEQCTAALSSLSNHSQHTQLLILRGALRAVISRPCLERDAVHAASFFANMARSPDLHVEVAHGGLRILLLALSSKDDKAVREGARGIFNLSLGGVSKVMIGQRGGLHPLITAARSKGDARRFAVGALAEISDAFEQATKMIEADIVSVLLTAVRDDASLARDVAKCIANLSLVAETHGSLAQSGAAEWLVEMISRNGGRGRDAADVMHFCTLAVCNIAYSPGITRTTLRENGAVRILTALSSSGMSAPLVLHSARTALNNLRGEKPVFVPVDGASRTASPA